MPFPHDDHARPLGRTGLPVTAISLGTSTLGNPAQPDGTPAPESAELARTLLAAPHAVIDTSNNYAGGRSETALGRAVAEHGLPAGHHIVTKADAEPGTGRFDRDRVWRSFEESTARLGLDRLPLLHLHDPYTITVEEAFAPGGAVEGMTELREQGLVGAIGIAAGDLPLMTRYVTSGAFDVLLTHNRYTLVDRRAEPLIAEAAERGMGVFNAAPFGGGLLAGTGTRYAYREAPPELLAWVERARELCARWSVDLPAVALRFSLRSPLVHSTVVGVGRPERIAQLDKLLRTPIPDEFWPALDALGTPPSTLDD
ncbi:aldo/keto reductase [Nonomuraea phyllanthi]|uniref:Aldo/keto reductase n=1 Tax=Nonomuraea phyllanthi TaxID=2219224 RepID=A0A5C4WTJ4_9ACTN|nr:aldo/keto reductase [Nonomuraea phyllanthi]KAB8196535.1 aldo/keto reductase [Nonomuraea phyllanthi]QFY13750.1 aldo/keto reductase [Nonomuraea phyllanthi]